MANLLQSSQTQAAQAPAFYTDYLSNLASQGQQAAQQAQYVGAQPLQQQAFQNVQNLPGTYQPTMAQAQQTLAGSARAMSPLQAGEAYLSQAAQSPAALAQQYMNPYINTAAQSMMDIAQRNIQQNLAPQATAATVGSGQYGSQRGAQVLGQVQRQAQQDVNNQIAQMLSQGYGQALQAGTAQNQLLGQLGSTAGQQASAGQQNLTALGQQLGNLAQTGQNLSLADINALATLGGQQQTIAQNQQLFPLTNLSTLSGMLRGYNIPISTTTMANASPLSVMASGTAGLAGMFTPLTDPVTGRVMTDASGKPITAATSLGGGLSTAWDTLKKSLPSFNISAPTGGTVASETTGSPETRVPVDVQTDDEGNTITWYSDGTYSTNFEAV